MYKKSTALLRPAIIIAIVFLNSLALAEGIHYKSVWGIVFALASLVALGYCIKLIKKLREVEMVDEEQSIH